MLKPRVGKKQLKNAEKIIYFFKNDIRVLKKGLIYGATLSSLNLKLPAEFEQTAGEVHKR